MNRRSYLAVTMLVAVLAVPAIGHAGDIRGRMGRGGGRPGAGRAGLAFSWDRAKEVILRGTVVTPPELTRGASLGSPMTIRTATGGEQRVLLGPPWFVMELGLKPAAGEAIEVIGLPAEERGQQVIAARQVVVGGMTYQLRTADGVPLWTGGTGTGWQRYTELWDRGRRETVTGRIEAVQGIYPGGQVSGAGVMLRLRTRENRPVEVHLGPAWFLAEQIPDLRPGQEVTVSGSDVRYQNQNVLLAETITRGGKTVRLRSAEGVPEWAGGWRNWGGWGPGSRYGRLYNPATAEIITGRVVRVVRVTPMNRAGQGLGIVVRTTQGRELLVHLAPAWYTQQLRLAPKVGDEVRVSGSVVQVQGRLVMLASALDWHDERVELRASDGQPLWAGRSLARR